MYIVVIRDAKTKALRRSAPMTWAKAAKLARSLVDAKKRCVGIEPAKEGA